MVSREYQYMGHQNRTVSPAYWMLIGQFRFRVHRLNELRLWQEKFWFQRLFIRIVQNQKNVYYQTRNLPKCRDIFCCTLTGFIRSNDNMYVQMETVVDILTNYKQWIQCAELYSQTLLSSFRYISYDSLENLYMTIDDHNFIIGFALLLYTADIRFDSWVSGWKPRKFKAPGDDWRLNEPIFVPGLTHMIKSFMAWSILANQLKLTYKFKAQSLKLALVRMIQPKKATQKCHYLCNK